MRKITEFPPLRANLDDESKLLTPHPSTKLFDDAPELTEKLKRLRIVVRGDDEK